ncbi:MAG TPA: hypothetical protein VFO76_01495 [Candidatus Kapabacteria bacterium]|nr:hypothetical protein [Candidatus Kapabacteria bacterium]
MDTVLHPKNKSFVLPTQLQYKPKRKNKILLAFQWCVILVAAAGFIYKFIEFTTSIFTKGNELVQFAITPIFIYGSVAAGFFMLFMWTVVRGDYKDIEVPKYRLFEREVELGDEEYLVAAQDVTNEVISMPISKN